MNSRRINMYRLKRRINDARDLCLTVCKTQEVGRPRGALTMESDQKTKTADWLVAPGNKRRGANCHSPFPSSSYFITVFLFLFMCLQMCERMLMRRLRSDETGLVFQARCVVDGPT